MKKSHISNAAFLLSILAVIIFVVSFCGFDSNIKSNRVDVSEYEGWLVDGEPMEKLAEPIQYSTTKATVYTNTISEDLVGKAIEFQSSHQRVYVYFGEELAYSVEKGEFFNHTAGTAYNIVEIPKEAEGKEIKIEIYNCYENYKNTEYIRFIYGSTGALYSYFISQEWFDDIIDVLLMISGIVVLLGSIVLIRYVKSTIDIIYLSLFEIFIAIWSLSESILFNVIVGNPSAMNNVVYFSLFLAPLFCLLYARNTTYGKNLSKRFITCVLGVHCSYIIVAALLQTANIVDFTMMLWLYHIILAFEVVVFGIYVIRDFKIDVQAGKKRSKIDRFLLLLLVGVGIDLIRWNFTYTYNTFLTRTCLLIYTTSIIIKFSKKVFSEAKENISKDELKQIAYTDQLTGIPNRNAFISRINNIDLNKVVVIAFDLNNLKYYNDRYGHDKGDLLLIGMAETIKKVFGNNAYRIGGDEFEVVLDECDQETLWSLLKQFESEEDDYNNQKNGIFLQAAYGVGYYQGEESINAIMKMADENMYTYKQFLKSKGVGMLK